LELLTIVAIIGILAMIVYPNMSRLIPERRISSEARIIEGYLQKARVKASNVQRPIRVVINCNATPCWVESQRAVYEGSEVDHWVAEGDKRFINSMVAFMNASGGFGYDGEALPSDWKVFFAIYMPDSRVYSNPRPFELFLYNSEMKADVNPKDGWNLSVSNDSGRVLLKRDSRNTT
jgi:hypothetical protein